LGGLAVAAIATAVAVTTTGAPGAVGGYRTAEATTATVRQTLSLSGTVSPVHEATAAFQVAGTIAALDVAQGQSVTAGQTLASLDTTTVEQHVSAAQSTLSSAQAKLAEDTLAQSSTVALSTSTTASSGSAPATGGSGGASTLQPAQQKVLSTQQTADADSQKAATALANAQTACPAGNGGSPTTTTTTQSTSTSTTTPTTIPAACATALGQALAAQQLVGTDQKAVAAAESTLAQLLASSSPSGSGTTAGGSAGSATGSGTTGKSGGSPGGGSAGGTTSGAATGSAEQLASDQAAIDSADASLIRAQQALAEAQLVSPLAGTVASVNMTVGGSVTAGSTSDAITVINAGSFQATATLTGVQSSQVKVGDRARVTEDGIAGTLDGTVARVGPVDTNGSSYTYPLIVALPAGSHGIAAGSSARVEVVLHELDATLAVPSSAVNTVAPGYSYVVVLRSGRAVRRRVSVGVVGAAYTQITSGITHGTVVVLADLSAGVPSSNTATGGFGAFVGRSLRTGAFGGG
jgi:HlyD family secretion protein